MAFKKFTNSVRQLKADMRFQSVLVSKFINSMMIGGKKSVARQVFYDAMDRIAEKVKDATPIEVFEAALENVRPDVEVRSRRVGGANYQVPTKVDGKRGMSLAIRWLLEATRKKGGVAMSVRLSDEIMAAFRREGDAMTMRENVHRMADANRAFAHYAAW